MPIEIRELVIKAAVNGAAAPTAHAPAEGASQLPPEERRRIIEDCVEQVMILINQRQER